MDDAQVSPEEQAAFNAKWDGRFEQLAGRAQQIWGDVTDDVVTQAEGSVAKLYGYIKEKSGDTLESILAKIDDAADSSES